MSGNVLLVGEFISNGGVGLQGDIITVTSLGGKPMAAVALMSTVRNPMNRVYRTIDKEYILQQLNDCAEKPGYDAIKIGALGNDEMVTLISDYLKANKGDKPVVYSPVLVSDVGAPLLDVTGIQLLQKYLIPRVDLLVVNVYDAEILSGTTIGGADEMATAARRIIDFGAKAVLITGGLLEGADFCDVFMDKSGAKILKHPKSELHLQNNYRFGGSWILATAVTTSLAQGFDMMSAIHRARQYVNQAIAHAAKTEDKYQNLFLTHTVQSFEYQPEQKIYEVISHS